MADTIDINVFETTEVVTINATPNLIQVNINKVTSTGAVSSVNGQTGDVTIATSDNNFTNTLKTKLDGIQAGAEINVNADWNATVGDAVILNKPSIPSIAGLESQSNKQNSLATDGTGVKYPTVDAVNSGLLGVNTNAINRVTVKLSQAINKGQAVYVSGANGTNILVSKASNTSEATSSKTIGLLETTGTTNDILNVVTDGLLTGLNTSTATIGDPVWLGTNGDLIYGLTNKPYAPAHLVYIGVVTRVNTNNGEILIKVQNGFELREIHDVDLISNSPTNNQALIYESASSLWKNKTIDKTFVGLGNVDNTSDANKPVSTAQQTALDLKVDKVTGSRLITSAESTIIGNTSGVNSGDETLSTIKTKLGITTLSGSNTGDQDLSGYVPTTRTVNTKPLSANVVLTTADIADSTNKRYVTDANLTTIGNQSGTNTGDETQSTILSKLAYYNYKNTSSSSSTSSLSETQLLQVTIPANTFSATDFLKFTATFVKTGVTAVSNIKFKLSTSSTMPSGSTGQIATVQIGNTSLFGQINRNLSIKSGNITGYNFGISAFTDNVGSTSAISSQSFDPTVTNYFYVSATMLSISDSLYMNSIQITNI
jgi:hypothetical protein